MKTSCFRVAVVKRTVGAAVILLTSTVTACSGSEPTRSWSEFEACARSFGADPNYREPYLPEDYSSTVSKFRSQVDEYRAGTKPEDLSWSEYAIVECEKVMPLWDDESD